MAGSSEQNDAFMCNPLTTGENGGLHSLAWEGGWLWCLCFQQTAHCNNVLLANDAVAAELKTVDKAKGHTEESIIIKSF